MLVKLTFERPRPVSATIIANNLFIMDVNLSQMAFEFMPAWNQKQTRTAKNILLTAVLLTVSGGHLKYIFI